MASQPGNIIVLNGTSSSGKTSIVRALQDLLVEPYLDAGIDKFIWMLPKRYLDRPLWDDVLGRATQAGVVGERLISGMHRAVAALSIAGNHVILDHVLVQKTWLKECAELFCELPAIIVGVFCPLEIVLEREKARRDRTLGQAKAQFDLVHAHRIYDLEVDTSVNTPEECARKVLGRLENPDPPLAFKRIRGK